MSSMLPEDLMAALGGGGPAGPGGGPQGPVAPTAGEVGAEEPSGETGGGETTSILRQMIDSAKAYIEAEQDEEDKLTMAKILTQLQQYLADEQREQDGMAQGKITPKGIRKMAAASGPAA